MDTIKSISPHFCNITFMKNVKKRATGEIVEEPGDTLYSIPKASAARIITHHKLYLKDGNCSLAEYIKQFKELYEDC